MPIRFDYNRKGEGVIGGGGFVLTRREVPFSQIRTEHEAEKSEWVVLYHRAGLDFRQPSFSIHRPDERDGNHRRFSVEQQRFSRV